MGELSLETKVKHPISASAHPTSTGHNMGGSMINGNTSANGSNGSAEQPGGMDDLYNMDDFLPTPMENVNGHPPHPQQPRATIPELAMREAAALKDRFDIDGMPELHDANSVLVCFKLSTLH